jgi:hypothetical protein
MVDKPEIGAVAEAALQLHLPKFYPQIGADSRRLKSMEL